MKRIRGRCRKILSILLCAVLLSCSISMTAAEELSAATPTDLAAEEEPFRMTETLEGTRITVTAEAGVFPEGSTLTAARAVHVEFEKAAETTLNIDRDRDFIAFHKIYRFSGAEMKGNAQVRIDEPELSELQIRYPDSEVSAFVMRYDENGATIRDRAVRIPAKVNIQRNTVSFSIDGMGLYDMIAAVRMPEQEETVQEAEYPEPVQEEPAAVEAEEEQPETEPAQDDSAPEEPTDEQPEAQEAEEPAAAEPEPAEPEAVQLPEPEPAKTETVQQPEPVRQEPAAEQPAAAAVQHTETAAETPVQTSDDENPEPAREVFVLEGTTAETDKVRAFIIRCYWLILGREPDQTGMAYWEDKLKNKNATAAEIISGFVGSTEFSRMHKSSEELIEILYRTMLNRASDETGRRYWNKMIADGVSLNQLVNGFCDSNEFRAICSSYGIESGSLGTGGTAEPVAFSERQIAFVTRCYRQALNREPDAGGLQYWCRKLATKKASFAEVASGFVFSDEMKNKKLDNEAFIKMLYRLYLDREAEPEGLKYWKQKMSEGMTREQVNEGFADSLEFANLVSVYDPETGAEPEYNYIIVPDETSMTINNGAKVKAQVSPELAEAGARLQWSSSDSRIFTVNQEGEILGCYPGRAVLRVADGQGITIAEITVNVMPNYRAILFSESTFAGGVIKRNRGDVRLMKNMLSAVTAPDGGQYKVYSYDDLVASAVYQKINQCLVAPSREGDVSIFFFASHGDYRSTSQQYAGRLWCKNKATWLELPELARVLSNVKGKVIVLLESCGPGAAIREFSSLDGSTQTGVEPVDNPDMTGAVISAFAAADPGLTEYRTSSSPSFPDSAGNARLDEAETGATGRVYGPTEGAGNLFLTEKFIVMTASAYLQTSYSAGQDACNLFPKWLTKGVGTSGTMPADTECGNSDGNLTVNELFQYVYKHTIYRQTPQVYPQNSSYVLFRRK